MLTRVMRTLVLMPLLVALLFALSVGDQRSFASDWTLRGSPIFFAEALADDPSHPGWVYAVGARGNVSSASWTLSTDGGQSWSEDQWIGGARPIAGVMLGITVSPAGVLIAGGAGGLFRSDDGGDTWTESVFLGTNRPSPRTDEVEVAHPTSDPRDPHRMLVAAAAFPVVYESTDDGQTFGQKLLPVRPAAATVPLDRDLEQLIYLGANHLMDQTVVGAESWMPVSCLPDGVFAMAIDPADLNVWYAICFAENTPGGAGLWRTTDGGGTWLLIMPSPNEVNLPGFVEIDARDPTGRSIIVGHGNAIGDETIEWSPDQGTTWVPLGSPPVRTPSLHQINGLHQIGDRLLVAANDGIWEARLPEVPSMAGSTDR